MKKVKCKKCKLTYDKDIYECPYCHTKRFNIKPVIMLLLVIAVIGVILYKYNILSFLNNGKIYIDDFSVQTAIIEDYDNILKNIEIDMLFTNENINAIEIDNKIAIYIDDVLYDQTYAYATIEPNKKYQEKDYIFIKNEEWKKLEVYYYSKDEKNYKKYTYIK